MHIAAKIAYAVAITFGVIGGLMLVGAGIAASWGGEGFIVNGLLGTGGIFAGVAFAFGWVGAFISIEDW